MKLKNGIKLLAAFLAAAIIFTDFYGACALTYASQANALSGEAEGLELLEDGGDDATKKEPAPEEFDFSQAEAAFAKLLEEYSLYGVLAHDIEFPIYQEASSESPVVKSLASGHQVKLTGVAWKEGGLWMEVGFAVDDVEYSGFVQSEYVVSSDERLAEWESQFWPDRNPSQPMNRDDSQASAFPASYRPLIQKLIQAHPKWTFVPMDTGLSWADVLRAEMEDSRNLVELSSPDSWKSKKPGDYNSKTGKWVIKSGTNWVQAAEGIVKHYLDPRNFLTEESVFQFEQLVYGKHHTEAGVEKILSGTFMAHKKLEDGSANGSTYAQAFIKIGKELKVSPYFLASRVRQEQGTSGKSDLISGKYPGYEGYYNYFNRRATGVGQEVIVRGLQEAKDNGWNSRYKALKGGAQSVASDYIFKGQDTFYLQKFDVDASYDGLYWHQYMQNLLAADSEGKSVQRGYQEMGILNNGFVFKVPVYKDMPGAPCPKPEESIDRPSLSAKKNGYEAVTLSWYKVSAAQGYQIYRADGAKGAYKKIASVDAGTNTLKDTSVLPGTLYQYKVRAYMTLDSGSTKYSAYSDVKSVDLSVPATAWGKLTVKNYRTIELSWKKKAVDGYKVYRKDGNGSYRCIGTLTGKSAVSFKDKTVKPGKAYAYRICGYVTLNGKAYSSAYTSVKKKTVKMEKPLLKKAAVSGKKKIKLTWKRDAKADGYAIYRSTSKKGGYKKIKDIGKNKTVKWTDSAVKAKKTYYYKIRSYVNASNGTKLSGYSAAVSVRT